MPERRRWAMLVVVVLGLGLATPAVAPARAAPRCFGAASRDPLHPCHNPALDHSFVPSVGRAMLTLPGPCRPVPGRHPVVCTFGVPLRQARRTIAVIGDSHSVHWRAALARIAAARRWHVYQVYHTQCPFSAAQALISGPNGAACAAWKQDVLAWVRRHPSVDTVIVSEHRVPVRVPQGRSRLATEVGGYVGAWTALPSSVRRIVVIRDTPHGVPGTPDCLNRAVARHRRPGIACRLRRSVSLHVDPAARAAVAMHSPRVRLIDLTHYFCGARYCWPVIGGVLVRKDHGHMTRVYSRTMAPYLDRALEPLLPPRPTARAASATGSARPRCFGAASRDPLHPCHNPALDRTVTPSLGDALLDPGAPCRIVRQRRPEVCAFGVPPSRARDTIASIGDSHSAHWRAALAGVAADKHWHAYQLYRSSCPYSLAPTVIHPPDGALCERWRRDVIAWVTAHPEVSTVFVSEHRVHVAIPFGQTRLQTEIKGYIDAWAALPSTVRHIYVIRDTPYNRFSTRVCISRALAKHERPGLRCRVPRRVAIHLDPAAIAARELGSPRVSVLDLTHYFCGARFCYPVIGGVLVHIDDDHITRVYSASLAPYLHRAIHLAATTGP